MNTSETKIASILIRSRRLILIGAFIGLVLSFVLIIMRANPRERTGTRIAVPHTPIPTMVMSPPMVDTSGMVQDIPAPQITLEKIDSHPLYILTYNGTYQDPDARRRATARRVPDNRDWGCSLFAAFGPDGQAVYGRNFDWDFSPAVFVVAHPPGRYASVSMVDITYLGFEASEVGALMPTDARLLDAPLIPFDGMNDQGLTVAMASMRGSQERPADPRRTTVGSLGIMRLLLDHAKTIDEAIALLHSHTIDFTGGPPLHYLIADRTGHSALIEFIDGAMQITRNDQAWQVATNFFLTGASETAKLLDERYAVASAHLQKSKGTLSPTDAMALLQRVRQDSTQWSTVYDMRTGNVQIVMGQQYHTVHTFHLDLAPRS